MAGLEPTLKRYLIPVVVSALLAVAGGAFSADASEAVKPSETPAPSPDPSPSPSEEPSPSPSEEPSPSPSEEPSPSPSETASPSPPRTVTTAPSPTPATASGSGPPPTASYPMMSRRAIEPGTLSQVEDLEAAAATDVGPPRERASVRTPTPDPMTPSQTPSPAAAIGGSFLPPAEPWGTGVALLWVLLMAILIAPMARKAHEERRPRRRT
jgi:hypothetical protein